MTTGTALLYTERPDGVAEITLNRPEIRNAFDNELIQSLITAFKRAEAAPLVSAILLGAAGKHFSAGADLNWMKGMAQASYQENLNDARQLAFLMATIDQCSKPVVAKVQGAAFGGAIGLLSCSDMVISDGQAKFALSEVKLGLSPATISPYVIDAIGKRAARQLFLTGEVFDAEKALRIGLVSELAQPNTLDEQVEQILSRLLKNGPVALSKTKSLIARVSTEKRDDALIDYTCELIAELRVSDEGQEGLSAFLEKRAPRWTTQPDAASASASANTHKE